MKSYTIWQNYDLKLEDYLQFLEEAYPDASELEQLQLMEEINDGYLDDEKLNLNIELSENIVVIADLGLWSGRSNGFKELGKNINCCLENFSEADFMRWELDELGDLCSDQTHHDGTNHLMFRKWKDNLSETQKDNFREKVLEGTVTRKDINRYTERLGDYIADVYGWNIRKKSNKAAK